MTLHGTGTSQYVQHGETDYLLFWAGSNYTVPSGPQWTAFQSGMQTWLTDLAGADGTSGNPISVTTQYYDNSGPGGSKSYIPYSVVNAGTIVDSDPYPANGCTDTDHASPANTMPVCLTDNQIQTELSNYITAHNLPVNLNTEYFVLTPQNVGSCFDASSTTCSYTGFCGYHTAAWISSKSAYVTYANLPWAYNVTGCEVWQHPNANYIDAVTGVFSHELAETMTDPLPGSGWTDASGGSGEIGDKCAYTYGGGGYGSMTGMNGIAGGYWNIQLGADDYLLQQEYDNQILNCSSRLTETWNGGASAASWSNTGNWAAAIAPGAGASSGASVNTLSFPALTSCSATCYSATNDLTSLTARQIQIDDGKGYSVGGNALTLGSGGISATTSAATSSPSSLNTPITLGANQSWSVDGGTSSVGKLSIGGAISGSSTLQASLANGGSLTLGADDEVGNVTVAGSSSSHTGASASQNGTVTVNSKLNGTDGNNVALTYAELSVPTTATVGALSVTGGDVEVGQSTTPAGKLTVSGGLSLDSASRLTLYVAGTGTTGGTDYSQVASTGNVTLGGSLTLGTASTCPALTYGSAYNLITTTGTLSGTFSGVPNGQIVSLSCTGTAPRLAISYGASAVIATVVPPVPVNSAPPTVSGTAQQGQTLTEAHGTWSNSPTAYTYQWEDCDNSGANCSVITGANGQTYTPTSSDVGHTLVVQETASNAGGSSSPASSAAYPANGTVLAAVPVNGGLPTISGTAQQGQTLTEAHGTWSNSPTSYAYQWEDCNGSGTGCVAISGATSQTYTLTSTDVGHTIVVQETAHNTGGDSSPASSAAYPPGATVLPPPPSTSGQPTISGTAQEGQTLTEAHATWSNSPTSYSYQWEDCNSSGASCVAITGATNQTYILTSSDVGHTIVVQESATDAGGTSSLVSSVAYPSGSTVLPLAPSTSGQPGITGTAQQGELLIETHASWSPTPTSYTYQWLDCDGSGNSCSPIAGATSQSYTTTASDVGHSIVVQETAANAGGSGVAASAPTALIAAPPATATGSSGSSGTGTGSTGTGGSTTPTPTPPPTRPAAGSASIGHAQVSGHTASVMVTCVGASGSTCSITVVLWVTEKLKGGKVVAVGTAASTKSTTKVVVLGSVTVTLSAGQSRSVQVSLNGAGKLLLAARHSLTVRLSVGQQGRTLSSSNLSFKTKPAKKRHR